MSDQQTEARIWATGEQRDRINDLKQGNETQADVLGRALDALAAGDDAATPAPEAPDADAIADAVAERVVDDAAIDAEDVAAAVADELSLSVADIKNAAEAGAQRGVENLR